MYHTLKLARALACATALSAVCAAPALGLTNGLDIPTGGNPSPLFGAQPWTQPLGLFEEFGTLPMPTTAACTNCTPMPATPSCFGTPNGAALDTFLKQRLYPMPTRTAYTTQPNYWAGMINGCIGPQSTTVMEGRPPGEWFAHQRWAEFPAQVYFQSATTGARVNNGLRDPWQRHGYTRGEFKRTTGLYWAGGTTRNTLPQFHPNMPVQNPSSLWTFDGTFPPKLLMARYGESVLFRHFNALPVSPADNGGFGAHTLTTHNHNGHNGSESDGYAAAFFFPGEFYDYHWPVILAGHDTINTGATSNWAGAPDGAGGITRVRGDWRETMSTHWFHDHMLDHTAQNVYKGSFAMMNIYSSIDRGNETIKCNYSNINNPNMCFPSGNALDWGNRDYDVNLALSDKAWRANGQLWFNIFNTNGFLGDRVLVNLQYDPYMQVRARRYRFRILNASVSRYYKLAVVTEGGQRVPFYMIANDGNIMEHTVAFPNAQSQDLPVQGIAERFDIIVDFTSFAPGTKIRVVNTLEHTDPRGPAREIPLASVLDGSYRGDPGVGPILEFRVVAYTGVDKSMNPADYVDGKRTMIPFPAVSAAEIAGARQRTFRFDRFNGTDDAPWTIMTDENSATGTPAQGYGMDPHRVSAAPTTNEWEVWHLKSGGGWAHPVHIHFEEGRVLERHGAAPPVWEAGARKDVYRIGSGPDSSQDLTLLIRFREFLGTYMEHCHNTMHEDHSMLLRWDIRNPGQVTSIPSPVATWAGVGYEASYDLPTATTGGDGQFGPEPVEPVAH